MIGIALAWLDKYAHDIAIGLGVVACVIIMIQTARLENAKRDLKEARLQVAVFTAREKAAAEAAAAIDKGSAKITVAASDAQSKVQTVIQWRTQTLIKEVPNVVTQKVDTDFRIPNGPLRLWDNQMRAEHLGGVPDAPGEFDGDAAAASPVVWSGLAPWGLETIGAGQACRAELAGLQGWIRDQAQLWGEASH